MQTIESKYDNNVVRVRLRWSLENRPLLQSIAQLLGTARPAVRYATCPSCKTTQVRQLARRDSLDRFILRLWTPGLMLFGGRLYHCGACQVQFYDCRKQAPEPTPRIRAPAPTAKLHTATLTTLEHCRTRPKCDHKTGNVLRCSECWRACSTPEVTG